MYYRKMEEDLSPKHREEILTYIDKMYSDGELDITVVNYLHEQENRTSKFYLLPKIHKGVIPPPGRPILSANGSPTEKISQLVDHFLNPISMLHKSYVKDTTHFLQILQNIKQPLDNAILITLDVTSLYTNIPTEEGLKAVRYSLNKHRKGSHNSTNESLINLLEFVLTKNNFRFDDQHFLQIWGSSMGSKVSPSYANIYMNWFESTFVYTYPLQPIIWVRFLDDCFGIWTHGQEELDKFLTYLNGCHDHIKFTLESSTSSVNFLDTKVKLVNNAILTDLYCKPTDSHNYLLFNSAHPLKCKQSIPFSQFLRIRRICSTLEFYDNHVVEFANHFLKRGYPLELIEEAAVKARRLDRATLLAPKTNFEPQSEDNILVTTYHPNDNSLPELVHGNWDLLGKSLATEFLHQKRPKLAYRRPQNLRDLLVQADVRIKTQITPPVVNQTQDTSTIIVQEAKLRQTSILHYLKKSTTHSKHNPDLNEWEPQPHDSSQSKPTLRPKKACTNPKCKFCPLIDKSGSIECHTTGQNFFTKENVTCQSSNLIYCITCLRCGKHYVGQTKRPVYQRLQEHLRSIKQGLGARDNNLNTPYKPQPVGIHFSQKNHIGQKDVKVQILDFVHFHPDSKKAEQVRLRVEKKWIHRLRCPAPNGMNIFD